MASIPPVPLPASYPADVVKAVTDAYYPRAVALADAARSRAQSAYALASALAAGLIGAGLLTSLDNRIVAVKLLGVSAVLTWAWAARGYLEAVAAPVPIPNSGAQPTSVAFVNAVLVSAKQERDEIDRRQRLANLAAVAAILLTLATFSLALLTGTRVDRRSGVVALSPAGAQAVGAVCGRATATIHGTVDRASIGSEFLDINVDTTDCKNGSANLHLPKADIVAVRLHR
jgi:hypothetical protein